MKVHRNLTIVEVDEPVLLTELEAATALSEAVVARLSPTTLVIDDRRSESLLRELVQRGYAPRVIER